MRIFPLVPRRFLACSHLSRPTSFNERASPGEVIEILNDHLGPAESPAAPFAEPRIKLTAASDQKKTGYKPLAMKLSEASEILDDRIDDFAALVQAHHGLDDAAFDSAASQSTSQIVAVGRIASDSAEGKLNAASLVLETSRRTGMGFRVPLKMDAILGWSFFPGQMVALRGSNAQGSEFVVAEVLELPLLPSAASAVSALEANSERLRGGPDAMESDAEPAPLNIMFASGPFTADDNLDYEPLHALCTQAADAHADALVLTGPFVDVDHPLVATGDFDLPEDADHDPDTATLTTLFKYTFAPALNRLCASNPHLVVILVPSVRDVLDKHVSWPQDTIPRKELGVCKSVRVISNPMTLSLNEMVLGVSSQDVLYELRSEELTKGGAPRDLMSRLCRYLVEQRHYFPLFPPTDRARLPKTGTAEGIATGAVLDLSYLKLGEMVNVRPDVMLVPSALSPFVKVRKVHLYRPTGMLADTALGAGRRERSRHQPGLPFEAQRGRHVRSHDAIPAPSWRRGGGGLGQSQDIRQSSRGNCKDMSCAGLVLNFGARPTLFPGFDSSLFAAQRFAAVVMMGLSQGCMYIGRHSIHRKNRVQPRLRRGGGGR